jgi:hypothetical protein
MCTSAPSGKDWPEVAIFSDEAIDGDARHYQTQLPDGSSSVVRWNVCFNASRGIRRCRSNLPGRLPGVRAIFFPASSSTFRRAHPTWSLDSPGRVTVLHQCSRLVGGQRCRYSPLALVMQVNGRVRQVFIRPRGKMQAKARIALAGVFASWARQWEASLVSIKSASGNTLSRLALTAWGGLAGASHASSMTDWLAGTWTGTGSQLTGPSWSMRLSAHPPDGGNACKIDAADGSINAVFFIEHIVYGRDRCVDLGRITVSPLPDASGSTKVVRMAWRWDGRRNSVRDATRRQVRSGRSGADATAILTR